jgi:hypothetical protein
MTTDEKRKLGAGLCHLSPEDLSKALELVAQDNPSFQTSAEEVELDMDAQVKLLSTPLHVSHSLACLPCFLCVYRVRRPSGG